MKAEKLSVNKVCVAVCIFLLLLSASMSTLLYFLTENRLALYCGLLYSVAVFGCMALFLAFIRRKLALFSDALCKLLDDMMSSDQEPPQYAEEENLFYKIQHRLSRLYEVLRESKSSIAKERDISSGKNSHCKLENDRRNFAGTNHVARKAARISFSYGWPVR